MKKSILLFLSTAFFILTLSFDYTIQSFENSNAKIVNEYDAGVSNTVEGNKLFLMIIMII